MEFEQIIKQLDWLDEERRKDKATIAAQEEQIAHLKTDFNSITQKTKKLEKEIEGYASLSARVEQFDSFLAQQRKDMNETYSRLEENARKREEDIGKRFQGEFKTLNETLSRLHNKNEIVDIRREMKVRESEDLRLGESLIKLKTNFDEVLKSNNDLKFAQDKFEDNRNQDIKQLTDTQGEIVALRKRLDEEREKRQLNADSLSTIDNRVADVLSNEHKRKQEQTEFYENFSLEQVDRERAWKEWVEKTDSFAEKSELLETQLQTVTDATRSAQKAEETYTEISERIERRAHEITEMQRLAEDRLRQEWVTFKADDQKRWTGYGLSQDETLKNIQNSMAKIEDRLTALDDASQTMQDQLQQTTDVTEHQMQELMNWAHEWLGSYERVMGHANKNK